jgi:hypothetical protein
VIKVNSARYFLASCYLLLAISYPIASMADESTASEDLIDRLAIPKNSNARDYGGGWDCDIGFFKDGESCKEILLPKNALQTDMQYSDSWVCRRGYMLVGRECEKVLIPENAYLNAPATRWECERGFREINQKCEKIEVPVNGFLTDSIFGRGWKCERGFKIENELCVALEIPDNGHIDYSGHDWECDRPFIREGDTCTLN